jgi:hypothetical protein
LRGRPVALIIEVVPSFEADDRSVLADLRESADYWTYTAARRPTGSPSRRPTGAGGGTVATAPRR